jgi:glycosyltransferase involved in cell wall biosynthesis
MNKIAYIAPRFHPFKGGAEQNLKAMAEIASNKGFDTTVLTTNVKFNNEKLAKFDNLGNIKIIRFWALNESLYAGFYPELMPHLISHNYDVIHSTGFGFFWRDICLIIKKIISPRTKFICTPHGPFMAVANKTGLRGFVKRGGTLFLKIYLNWLFDSVIAVTDKQEDWLTSVYKISRDKIIVIPNGIYTDYIEGSVVDHSNSPVTTISYINRLEEYKGVQQVLKTLDMIKKNHPEIRFKFVIMGRSGNYTETLVRMTKDLNLVNEVEFKFSPTDEERDRVLKNESVINILPSRWEATGIALLEAMAKGNIPITTVQNEGHNILIEDGINGFYYDFEDINKLAEILKRLLSDSNLRMKMRRLSLEKSRKLTWESVGEKYLGLINQTY